MKSIARREARNFLAFTGISLLGFAIFYVYPVIRTFYLSLTNTRVGVDAVDFLGFRNYEQILLKDPLFWHSMRQSFLFSFIAGPLSLLVALYAAMLLNRKVRFIGVFRTIFFLPFVIPTFAVASVFKGFLHPSSGIINRVLSYLGIQGPGWYMDSSSALATLILISSWGFGVSMLIFLAALQNVPASYYEVADLDGASAFQKFRYVTFPFISPVFFFNVVLATINGLKSFNLAFLMGRGLGFPANSTLLFPVYLFVTAFRMPYKLGYASALAWVFFLVIMALTGLNFLLSRYYVNEDVE